MAKKKNTIYSAFDGLPWIVKIIFALPFLGFIWGIYRVIKGLETKNGVLVVIGILWIVLGWAIFWIVDLISILIYKKPVVLV